MNEKANRMKKFGFTIAETLVVLGVIGTIAMLTMPTFIANQRKQIYAKTLQIAITNFNTAMTNLIIKEGVDDLSETTAWTNINNDTLDNSNENDAKTFIANLNNTLKLTKYSTDEFSSYLPLSENPNEIVDIGNPIRLFTKNGIEYKIQIDRSSVPTIRDEEALEANVNYTEQAATVYIDINGEAAPNIMGRDLFQFDLGVDGILYAYGDFNYSKYHNDIDFTTPETGCLNARDGSYCAAYLIENNYNMDY